MTNPAEQVTETVGEALLPDHKFDSRAEFRTAARILTALLVVVVLVVAATFVWGLPALTMIALGATVLVMLLLIAYAAGL